jgi:glycosyltransferase involved in cell wall biosynthesis
MKTIIFFISSLNATYIIKRIVAMHEAGFNVIVYGFDRGLSKPNAIPSNIETHNLGNIINSHAYMSRPLLIILSLLKILKKETSKDALLYVAGLDNMFFASIFLRNRYIYEICDLRYINGKLARFQGLLRIIDRWLIKKSFLTVLTSDGFNKYLFGSNVLDNIIIQPNKLNKYFHSVLRPHYSMQDIYSLKFGFVGTFRYFNIINFAEVVGKYYPKHHFNFYGNGQDVYQAKVKVLSKKYNNVTYFGAFKNPDDLMEIYQNIDILVCCYETTAHDARYLEPNKLYEALYFQKPIIVSTGTFLAEQVKKYGCGYVIDVSTEENIVAFIDSLNANELLGIHENCRKIDTNECIDDPQQIIDYINNNYK